MPTALTIGLGCPLPNDCEFAFTWVKPHFVQYRRLQTGIWAHEESLRIPLLMRYPKLTKPGTALDQFALSIDLAPTLLELANVSPPDTMQGRSLLPLLKENTAGARTSFLAEFFLGNGTNRFPTWQAVRTERWKYIRYTDQPEMDKLYDLHADRGEMHNRIDEPKSATALVELKTELERLLRETQSG